MTDNDETGELAALMAVKLYDLAKSETPLFTVRNHYPSGSKAFEVGFMLTWGAITALGVLSALAWVIGEAV